MKWKESDPQSRADNLEKLYSEKVEAVSQDLRDLGSFLDEEKISHLKDNLREIAEKDPEKFEELISALATIDSIFNER